MDSITIYMCDDSVDGILTGVYDAWSSRKGHAAVRLKVKGCDESMETMELFAEYTDTPADSVKAVKVAKAIREQIGLQAYEMVVRAALTTAPDKAEVIYRFLVMGFAMGARVTTHITDNDVARVFELNRFVTNDVHFFKGFLRFEELKNGILLARYEPQNNITAILAEHFADRFPEENFIIYDITRRIAAVHERGHAWLLIMLTKEAVERLEADMSEDEGYEKLWITFFTNIAIKERTNEKLQRNNIRMHYRRHMPEFKEHDAK